MSKLNIDDHPTVKLARQRLATPGEHRLDAQWLKQLALDCGADDVGLVEFDRPALGNEQEEIRSRYPWTKTLLCFVMKMSREPIRSPARASSGTCPSMPAGWTANRQPETGADASNYRDTSPARQYF